METGDSQSVLVPAALMCVACNVCKVYGLHGQSILWLLEVPRTFPTEHFGERQITRDSYMQTGSHELWKFTNFYTSASGGQYLNYTKKH